MMRFRWSSGDNGLLAARTAARSAAKEALSNRLSILIPARFEMQR